MRLGLVFTDHSASQEHYLHVQVPLRRVNQAFVIATSTKLEVAGADVAKIGDEYFKAPPKARGKKTEEGFFETEEAKKVHMLQIIPAELNQMRCSYTTF